MIFNTVFILITAIRHQTLASLDSYVMARTHTEKYIVSYNGQDMNEICALRIYCEANDIHFTSNQSESYFSHANICCQMSQTKFITILHDDDLLNEKHFQILRTYYHETNTSLCTSDIIKIGTIYKRMRQFQKVKSSVTQLETAAAYLIGHHAVAFPSITYRTQHLRKALKTKFYFKKYSDAQVVIAIVKEGLTRIDSSSFIYVIHSSQDSKKPDLLQKLRLKIWLIGQLMLVSTSTNKAIGIKNFFSAVSRKKNV